MWLRGNFKNSIKTDKKSYLGFARHWYTDITAILSSLENKDHQMLEIQETELNHQKSDESKEDLAIWYNLSLLLNLH